MKSKAIFLALLAFTLGTQAERVYPTDAKRAVASWVSRKGAVGCQLGVTVDRLAEHTTTNGATFYAVKMSGCGTVFMSADTRIEPILAFTDSETDYSTIDRHGPLWALLNRDLSVRQALADGANRPKSSQAGATDEGVAAAEAKWAELLGGGMAPKSATVKSGTILTDGNVRVPKLVQSAWDQADAGGGYHYPGGKACYNYYTPLSATKRSPGNVNNAVCGCVATAMAQLMRYHRHPATAITPIERKDCFFDKTAISLTMQGGTYDWDAMPFTTSSATPEANLKAIGKLTSDAGISVGMMYTLNDSGSWSYDAKNALANVFGFKQVRMFDGYSSAAAKKVLYANFDAGLPVILGISGSGGHEIVGDGYGFSGDTPYVHLNMGWSGSSDVWYNLPDIDAGSHSFNVIDEIIYNIMPEGAKNVILSGRATDDEGRAVAGVRVRVRNAGTTTEVASENTNSKGIYAFVLPAGKYDLELELDGSKCADPLTGVVVQAPVEVNESGWGQQPDGTRRTLSARLVKSSGSAGNSWGNDFVVVVPTVLVEIDGEKQPYSCLDKALAAAKAAYEADPEKQPVTIEVIDATTLEKPFMIDFPCVLTSADPETLKVMRAAGAVLTVAAGGRVEVVDLTVEGAASKEVFNVQKGGTVSIGVGVNLGVSATVPAIVTAQADGFVLAGAPAVPFAVDCTAAQGIDAVFGYATCDFATAAAWAGKFVYLNDPNGEIAGVAEDGGSAPYALKWGVVEVPLEEATAYYVLEGTVKTNCFRRLDRLFELYEKADAPGEVTVLADGSMTRRVAVTHKLTIRSSVGATLTADGGEMGFDITNGAKVCVRGLVFSGATGDSLFAVSGEGSRLAIEPQTVISNFIGNVSAKSAAVRVTDGAELVVGGEGGCVLFGGCTNDYSQSSAGGAIHVSGAGANVALLGHVAIEGCRSRGTGGGVYVGKSAKILLSGELAVCENTSGGQSIASDIYCASGSLGIEVTGLIAAGSKVGVRQVKSGWNQPGAAFAQVAAGFDDTALVYDSAQAFFCDDKNLKAEPFEDYRSFVWLAEDSGIKPVDPEVAHVRIDGTSDHYGSLADALAVLDGKGGTIVVLRDTTIQSNLVVTGAVTLKGVDESVVVSRTDGAQLQVAADGDLTLEGLTLSGGSVDGGLIKVDGGRLTLENGAVVKDVTGGKTRNDSAIQVLSGGTLVMKSGSRIFDCENPFVTGYSQNGRGGAVTADDGSTVRLEGGTIENCTANLGGGVFIGNRSTIEIGGDAAVSANGDAEGRPGNVYVPVYSELRLISPLTGSIGVTQGETADPVVFGRPADEFAGSDAQLANSAYNFTNDRNGDVGFAVRNGSETLLVWSDGLGADGKYTDADGTVYTPVSGGSDVPTPVPVPVGGLVYTGFEQEGLEPGHGYMAGGVTAATGAGTYEAVLTLKPGFVWEDGTTAPKTVSWTIAKATYDMSGVTFEDMTAVYDGQPKTNVVTGTLPAGVSVAYYDQDGKADGNVQTEVGVYEITAKFTGDADNYEPIDDKTATLTITDAPPPPPPPPPPVETNYPTPIAFKSIESLGAGQWKLIVTNGVKDCWYSLFGGTVLDETTFTQKAKFQLDADGVVIFTVDTGTDAQWFWRAKAEPGEVRGEN